MVPIQGKPFLAYLLKMLAAAGMKRVVLCVGYLGSHIEWWLGNGEEFDLNIEYSPEEQPMGTAGALGLAYSRYARGKRVLAMNGDSLLQLSLATMWNLHTAREAEATIALTQVPDNSRYGGVNVNESGRVTAFREKGSETGPGWINGGVYLFEPSVMEMIVANRSVSLEKEVLPILVERGLLAFQTDGYFIDIGIPADLARAQVELAANSGCDASQSVQSRSSK